MFPLNTVTFPGASVPLRVFEPRYRALVEHLLAEGDASRRLFGTVCIREGYEVGDHGVQSLYRVGCRLQLTEASVSGDGYEILAVARDRYRMDRLSPTETFPAAEGKVLADVDGPSAAIAAERAIDVFARYLQTLAEMTDVEEPDGLPQDPGYLSWVLADAVPLPLSERQALLEAGSAAERLTALADLLAEEIRAMRAVPSLPATEVARTRWHPN